MEESRELYEAKSELLKALAHPLRLQIVRGLLVGGCHNVRCMEAGTGQSQSTISQHLMRLKRAVGQRDVLRGVRPGCRQPGGGPVRR